MIHQNLMREGEGGGGGGEIRRFCLLTNFIFIFSHFLFSQTTIKVNLKRSKEIFEK